MGLEDLADAVSDIVDFFRHPRFWSCAIASLGLAWLIHSQMTPGHARTAAMASVVVAGFVIGAVWESRAQA